MKLKGYIQKTKEAVESGGLEIKDEVLFEQAVKIFISDRITDSNKQGNKRHTSFQPNSPATQKQIYKLRKLGLKFPKDITKIEASKLISEAK